MKKSQLLKFGLPIGLGLTLLTITIMGLVSTTFSSCAKSTSCPSGKCQGTDGKCYGCSSGSSCSTSNSGNCSAPVAGVYCCAGGGTTTKYCNTGNTYNYSSQKCCPNSTPYYYPGTHGIKPAGCYSSCPYVGDCGTHWTKY